MTSIAILGKFAAGKSSLARELEDVYGFHRVSMANNLKMIVGSAYGTLEKSHSVEVTTQHGERVTRTVREVLQDLGAAVKVVDRDLWLRWMLKDTEDLTASGYELVMDDVRLQFEADALRDAGWFIVKLEIPEAIRMQRFFALYERYPTQAELNHPTEVELEGIMPDLTLMHDGFEAVESLADRVITAMPE